MPEISVHVGELVAEDIDRRIHGVPRVVRPPNRGDIKKITLLFLNGDRVDLPMGTRVITEY